MKRLSASALILVTILTISPTLYAQSQGYTTSTLAPPPPSPRSVYAEPIIIPAPTAPATSGIQESTVYDLNTGTMTLIRQEGSHITIIRP